MMRSQRLFRDLSNQTLCIFCATRLGVEAGVTRPRFDAPRRYLQSSRPTKNPPANAEAFQEEDDEPPTYQPAATELPRFGGGWPRSSFSSGLTPEEERQRRALLEATQAENRKQEEAVQARRDRLPRRYDGHSDHTSPSSIERQGYGNTFSSSPQPDHNRNRNSTSGTLPLRQVRILARWDCPSCEASNSTTAKKCWKCSMPAQFAQKPRSLASEPGSKPRVRRVDIREALPQDDRPYNAEIAGSWQHVRRKTDVSMSQAQNEGQRGIESVQVTEESEADRVLIKARLEREKQSRAARFVGFGGPRMPDDQRSVTSYQESNPEETSRRLASKDGSRKIDLSKSAKQGHDSTKETGAAGWTTWSPTNAEPKSTAIQNSALGEESGVPDEIREQRRRRRKEKYALKDVAVVMTHDRAPQARRQARRGKHSTRNEDDEDDEDLRFERKKQRKREKFAHRAAAPPVPIYLPEFISISNLATALRVKTEQFIDTMRSMGFEETGNDHVLDAETAGLIAAEYNYEPVIDRSESEDLQARPPAEDKSLLPPRPPVVTIMGHVDHGKTTLLDWLRKSSVAASEHGGITQHIGAFSVPMPSGKTITFLDTPGHAAFLSMRQRGANVTDIVVLVVAADDSVKPQTIEAIKHAKAAQVPIIVAVNKIDKAEADVKRVKQDLSRHGVDVEDFGGDTQVVCVSGKTGQGMEELEEAAVALADVLDMRAETDGPAEGWVLEATTKKAGRVATVLVRRGTLRTGDVLVAGSTWGRIRTLKNEAGVQVGAAGPGTPVEIDGWKEQPVAGDEVLQASDEQKAKSVVDLRLERGERLKMAADMEAVNESRRLDQEKREREEQLAAGEKLDVPKEQPGIKQVYFIIKGDVSGSVEAVLNNVSALGNEEVRPHILRSGVGPVAEFDVEHAAVAKGHIISFNMPTEPNIARMAEAAGVPIMDENIIYRLVDDVKAKLSEHLTPLITQRVVGEADIAQVFEIHGNGKTTVPIAGCKIRNGTVHRNSKVKVLRDKKIIYDGTISSLKNVKKDVTEMRKGNECGLGFNGWHDFQAGDQIQCYEEKSEKRSL